MFLGSVHTACHGSRELSASVSGGGHGLGLVATQKRPIRSGWEYDEYFDLAGVEGIRRVVAHGKSFRTLREMEKLVKATLAQTGQISRVLKGTELITNGAKIWHFLHDHVQYELDATGREQLRTPLRTWKDRMRGVDCDCYSIFISSVLTNLGIPHAFRMTKYEGDWQHVYVVVPKNGKKSGLNERNRYIVIDPVLDKFNYEKPFTKKHDHFMSMPIEVLSGIGKAPCCGQDTDILRATPGLRRVMKVSALRERGLVPAAEVLKEAKVNFLPIRDDQGRPALAVATPAGAKKLPTVITVQQAAQIKAAMPGNKKMPGIVQVMPPNPLKKETKVFTEDILSKGKIPFKKIENAGAPPTLLVETKEGTKRLPAMVTPGQAWEIEASIAEAKAQQSMASGQKEDVAKAGLSLSGKAAGWIALAALTGGILWMAGSGPDTGSEKTKAKSKKTALAGTRPGTGRKVQTIDLR